MICGKRMESRKYLINIVDEDEDEDEEDYDDEGDFDDGTVIEFREDLSLLMRDLNDEPREWYTSDEED